MKKIVSMFVSIMLLLVPSTNAAVQAQGNSKTTESSVLMPFYDYVTLVGASLSISSAGKATASGFVFYTGNYNSTLTIELQRANGSGWSSVKSWSKLFTSKGNHSFEEEYYVVSGNTYRVVTTIVIKDGNTVLETASSTSSQVVY